MDPATALGLINMALKLMETAQAMAPELSKVSDKIAARIASGAGEWTADELASVQADLDAAKAAAHA